MRPDVAAFYTQHGVPVTHNPDQDTTDLTKCIQHVQSCLVAPRSPVPDQSAQGSGSATQGEGLEHDQATQQGSALQGTQEHTILAIGMPHVFFVKGFIKVAKLCVPSGPKACCMVSSSGI